MLPVDNKYGVWPLSGAFSLVTVIEEKANEKIGEIDLLEARGNGPEYPAQGVNYIRSSLNYGPMASLYTQLYGWQSKKRSGFDQGTPFLFPLPSLILTTSLTEFHTYTLEWTRDFIRMSVDKKTIAMLEVNKLSTPKKSFWARGKYPQVASNWTSDNSGDGDQVVVKNIWEEADGGLDAPFDQRELHLFASLLVLWVES
jgi:Glycosyl hydrolases family 16